MAYISTAISVLALFGVCVSLSFQSHQARIAQMIGSRERHQDLMRLMMEHPELDFRRMADADRAGEDFRTGMSMWMSHWNMVWHVKKMDEKALRFLAADLFTRRGARQWWTEVGATWSSNSTRRERKFIAIVTAECIAASRVWQPSLGCAAEANGSGPTDAKPVHAGGDTG
ncbi:DUF6082 family protein [Actinoplanes sp. NPDC023936]|uniref:DUF6082 family protein n=1 Tax=Actinoplanes sp. NPDC023936 TaxID=3154910 RepID=UPI0033F9AB2A